MTQAHHIKYLYEVENKSLNSISKETGNNQTPFSHARNL